MTRQLVAVGAVLAVVIGCHDGPTAPAPSTDTGGEAQPLPSAVLATMRTLLDDPLVLDIIGRAHRRATHAQCCR